jgi:hypothetical protein
MRYLNSLSCQILLCKLWYILISIESLFSFFPVGIGTVQDFPTHCPIQQVFMLQFQYEMQLSCFLGCKHEGSPHPVPISLLRLLGSGALQAIVEAHVLPALETLQLFQTKVPFGAATITF